LLLSLGSILDIYDPLTCCLDGIPCSNSLCSYNLVETKSIILIAYVNYPILKSFPVPTLIHLPQMTNLTAATTLIATMTSFNVPFPVVEPEQFANRERFHSDIDHYNLIDHNEWIFRCYFQTSITIRQEFAEQTCQDEGGIQANYNKRSVLDEIISQFNGIIIAI